MNILSHVLGFTGSDNQGLMGIELSYDKELSGERGFVKFYSDAKGKRLENMADDYKPPVNGDNLKLRSIAKFRQLWNGNWIMRRHIMILMV